MRFVRILLSYLMETVLDLDKKSLKLRCLQAQQGVTLNEPGS